MFIYSYYYVCSLLGILSFNRTQSKVIAGLLAGQNTLRKHLYIKGLIDSPLCRKCGAKEETLARVLHECEALATLRLSYLGSFFLDLENVSILNMGGIWQVIKGTGFP